ncbi:MAG TPA: hypothetical protein VL181_06690 [Holophagaceae bacterium]|nr:hypothetical protein [Holophagaceae bacterium]
MAAQAKKPAVKRPGKRELRARVEAERAELRRRLQDLLRALALGPGIAADLEAFAAEGREAEALALLARHAGGTEGDTRRIAEAWTTAKAIAALPKV